MGVKNAMPVWAERMREIFRSETVSQFLLTGNIHDVFPYKGKEEIEFYSLKQYLSDIIFSRFDTILFFDRGKGLRAIKGSDHFNRFLRSTDRYSTVGPESTVQLGGRGRMSPPAGHLPYRSPGQILELIDRFLMAVARSSREKNVSLPTSSAVIIDYANFIIPRGASYQMAGETGANAVRILDWAENPTITGANIATVLISDVVSDLIDAIVDSPFTAKIEIPLPNNQDLKDFIGAVTQAEPAFRKLCRIPVDRLASRFLGLSRIHVKHALLQVLRNDKPVTDDYITLSRKRSIEKECYGKLEFIETQHSLDDIAGHSEVKTWLRNDALLLKRGAKHALPMGYLITGRIGTGKSFLVECFAGECGVPCVVMKNFRDKWVGATEKNLERVFQILKVFGQVVVFIDEADQITGQRTSSGSDSGLSGRIYGMLAKEMSNTANRGKILWVFATSRPDLLEIDLKRQGRLDVHIPLFAAEDPEIQRELMCVIARKMHINLRPGDVKDVAFDDPVTGSQIEGLLVRAVREYELQDRKKRRRSLKRILKSVILEFRPSSQSSRLELMDLLAVRECTDERFLPERFRILKRDDLDERIRHLTRFET
jgi:SpoVK/Ycf46/Vps4 family AAA+-type ATPase